MNKIIYLLLPLFFMSAVPAFAQVTIGKNEMPRTGAGLDLNTDNLGLLLPRIELINNLEELTGGNTEGLVIYNTNPSTNDGLQGEGVYLWDGGSWKNLKSSEPAIAPGAPDKPGEITFSTREVCPDEELTLSIDEVEDADSYTWNVPTGFTILDGQGTSSIIIYGRGSMTQTTTHSAAGFGVCAVNENGSGPRRTGAGDAVTISKWSEIQLKLSAVNVKVNRTGYLYDLFFKGECFPREAVTRWVTSAASVFRINEPDSWATTYKAVKVGSSTVRFWYLDDHGAEQSWTITVKVVS